MKNLLLSLLLILTTAALPFSSLYAKEDTVPSVPGLTLPAPMEAFVGDQFIKIEATSEGPVSFDVFALFDDESVELKVEAIGDKTLYIGIPNSPGAIRVTAATVIGGKVSKIASTVITVKSKEKPTPTPKTLTKYIVTVIGPVKSANLDKSLTALNCKYYGFASNDPYLSKRKDLVDRANSVGGQAIIIQDEKGALKQVLKYTSEADVISAINTLQKDS